MRKRKKRERERETARNTIQYQSGQCRANRALIAGREGYGSDKKKKKKKQGEGLCELFKEGGVIYRDPHIQRGKWGG